MLLLPLLLDGILLSTGVDCSNYVAYIYNYAFGYYPTSAIGKQCCHSVVNDAAHDATAFAGKPARLSKQQDESMAACFAGGSGSALQATGR
jgi:cytochrome c1